MLFRSGLQIIRPEFNHNYFSIIDAEDKAYFLGFLMADGCCQSEINRLDFAIHTKDRYILEIFKEKLNSPNNIRSYSQNNISVINHSSDKLIADLQRYGCVPKKSLTLEFPENTLPKEYMWDFIRGYFDGDGCATKHKNCSDDSSNRIRISFIGTLSFLTSLQKIFNTEYKLQLVGSNLRSYCLEITSKKNLDYIISNMYNNASIYLHRKRDICISHILKVD